MANNFNPWFAKTSLAELCSSLGAQAVLCSSPEIQKNGKNVVRVVDFLKDKMRPEFQHTVVSMVEPVDPSVEPQSNKTYWRGKISGGLTMALNRPPRTTTKETLNQMGIGALINMDLNKLHVAIAVVIDGGDVTQDEQKEMTSIVDEVVFDLRRRGTSWAMNTVILMVRFPDVESFVSSIAGDRNLMRTTCFETRQRDECNYNNQIFSSSLAWEAGAASGKGFSLLSVDCKKALKINEEADPQLLLQIARTGDTVGVRRLLHSKCNLMQAKSHVNFNALHACAYGGFADTAQAILEVHSQQEYLDSMKMPERITPLFFAAQFGHQDAARLLLMYQANVNLGRDDGQTPVYKAAHKGHKSIVEMFITAGAEFNTPVNDGSTPLFIASQCGNADVVATLIQVGASIHTPMKSGMTPIYMAAKKGHKEVVSLLAQAGANVNAPHQAESGYTPLIIASKLGHSEVTSILLNAGAHADKAATDGMTPLLTAVEQGHEAVVNVLMQAG